MLYATCYSSLQSVPNIPFYFFFNALLLVLTLMNIYWFLVSRGSSATPTLPLLPQLLLCDACCLPLQGGCGSCRHGEVLGFEWEGRSAVPRGLLGAGIENVVSQPRDPWEGIVTDCCCPGAPWHWSRWECDTGTNAVASPEVLGEG